MLNDAQLLDRAERAEAQAHNAYDQADEAHADGRTEDARQLYAHGSWLEDEAALCRAEAVECLVAS
jgi:phage shock protein A